MVCSRRSRLDAPTAHRVLARLDHTAPGAHIPVAEFVTGHPDLDIGQLAGRQGHRPVKPASQRGARSTRDAGMPGVDLHHLAARAGRRC